MGDRICIMNGGRVVQIGAPLDVYREPADTFVAAFLGSPATNLIAGRFNGETLQLGAMALPIRRRGEAQDVILGIRPEDIRIGGMAPHAEGEVLAVEPLGAETIVRFRLPDVAGDVIVRGPRTLSAKVGERAPVSFDLAAAHLFDPATTRRIV